MCCGRLIFHWTVLTTNLSSCIRGPSKNTETVRSQTLSNTDSLREDGEHFESNKEQMVREERSEVADSR